jgi:hypothetical protein
MPIPSQQELTTIVKEVYGQGIHKREPIEEYQRVLSSLPTETKSDKFILYVFQSILGEPGHGCQFITVTEPPYCGWIESKDFPIEVTDEAIEVLKRSGWDAGYPRDSRGEEKGKNVLIGDLDYKVALTAVERHKYREGLM